jgi:hypothetical protein
VHDHATRQVTFKELADEAMDWGTESRTEAIPGRAVGARFDTLGEP